MFDHIKLFRYTGMALGSLGPKLFGERRMKLTAVTKLCFATGLSLSCSFAGTPTLGVASALGTFSVNDAKVEGNANIFSGSQLKTDLASSRVYLQNGAALIFGTYSMGTLYKDHVVLEQGSARVDGLKGYNIEAGDFRIKGTEPLSQAVVRLNEGTVQVAALAGSVSVFNSHGVLLNRIGPGTASEFQNDANANPTPGQSGATAGQSGASAQTGATSGAEQRRRTRIKETELYLTLGVALGGLGLATDAILQPGSNSISPLSP